MLSCSFFWEKFECCFCCFVEESGALNIEDFRSISFVGSVFKLLSKDWYLVVKDRGKLVLQNAFAEGKKLDFFIIGNKCKDGKT